MFPKENMRYEVLDDRYDHTENSCLILKHKEMIVRQALQQLQSTRAVHDQLLNCKFN